MQRQCAEKEGGVWFRSRMDCESEVKWVRGTEVIVILFLVFLFCTQTQDPARTLPDFVPFCKRLNLCPRPRAFFSTSFSLSPLEGTEGSWFRGLGDRRQIIPLGDDRGNWEETDWTTGLKLASVFPFGARNSGGVYFRRLICGVFLFLFSKHPRSLSQCIQSVSPTSWFLNVGRHCLSSWVCSTRTIVRVEANY